MRVVDDGFGACASLDVRSDIWESMFDAVIDPTIKCIDTLLNHDKVKGKCKYLCLVGGLSTSPYFHQRIAKQFGKESQYKLKIIAPELQMLSVVKGAAYFGITENYVKSRVLRYTYGIKACNTEENAISKGVPSDYIASHRRYNSHSKINYVNNVFSVIARKDEEIHTGKTIKIRTMRHGPDSFNANKIILYSDKDDPTIASDGKELGRIEMKYDKTDDDRQESILEFHFSDTLIKVVTFKTGKSNTKQEAYIVDYE